MDLLENLNPMQKKAVLHRDGPLLLLAGAGSGKTRVITHRIAYLIGNGVKPWNILAITFTNKAAKEMRERVNSLVEFGAESVWVSTFHSMCVRILRRYIENIGYEKTFSIYDADDQERLVKECIKILNMDEKLFKPKFVMGEISSLKNELITFERYKYISQDDFRKSKIANVYEMYQKKLMTNNALDFDDLIFKTVDLFNEVPDVLEFYSQKCRYIMVDEYQDTNTAQYQLVKLLALKNQNLCVVGDDDQSIYGWRGANIRNILEFEKDFPNTITIKLEQNYRSTKNILNAANSVISNNRARKKKSLWTDNQNGSSITMQKTLNQYDEGSFIVSEIKNMVKSDKRYSDFAVLYRMNSQSRAIEEKMVQENIPYRLLGGTRFYDRKEIRDIISYLKAINNTDDDIALKRIINVPKRGIGNTTVDKATTYSFENGISFFEVLKNADSIQELGRSSKKLKQFANLIEILKQQSYECRVDELIDIIFETTGYIKELEAENTPEALNRIENLKEFLSKAVDYQKNSDEPSLPEFLEEIALVADIDSYEQDDNAVVMMTMHSSKGLEFPYVFIPGMEEGIFPSYRAIVSDNENELEEERRLCYVGITRAKEKLYLLCAKSRTINGSEQYNSPSRFLNEIPSDLIEYGDNVVSKLKIPIRKPVEKIEHFKPYSNPNIPKPSHIILNFEKGDRIKHKKFGEGIVKDIVAAGADFEILVSFDRMGDKRMMSQFANLEKI